MTPNTLRQDIIVLHHICTGCTVCVVPWMAKSDACTVCRGAMRLTWLWEGMATQDEVKAGEIT